MNFFSFYCVSNSVFFYEANSTHFLCLHMSRPSHCPSIKWVDFVGKSVKGYVKFPLNASGQCTLLSALVVQHKTGHNLRQPNNIIIPGLTRTSAVLFCLVMKIGLAGRPFIILSFSYTLSSSTKLLIRLDSKRGSLASKSLD